MALPANWSLKDILILSQIKGINYKEQIELINNFPSLAEFQNLTGTNLSNGKKVEEIFESSHQRFENEAENQLEICDKHGYQIITYWDENYPKLLREITHPPLLLYVWGNIGNGKDIISIVGTRKNTIYGKIVTEKYVEVFTRYGFVICSGLAYGIDTISHLQTIKNGGITYAVIASGLDKLSSQYTQKNATEIVEREGCIISEYKCGTTSLRQYFPQRNRIISGLARATLVIESGLKGGALITAKFAFDQGRSVFAVPGKILDEKSQGTNELIRTSIAALTVTPDDILEELGYTKLDFSNDEQKEIILSSEKEKKIYKILNNEPKQIDEIAEMTNLHMSELLVIILEMEFKGIIKQLPGKNYIRSY